MASKPNKGHNFCEKCRRLDLGRLRGGCHGPCPYCFFFVAAAAVALSISGSGVSTLAVRRAALWFPRAYFLFCRLRSSDFIQWLVEWDAFYQQHLKPTNEKVLRSNMFFEWSYAETYTAPLGRVSIVTTELSLMNRADAKVRNKDLLLPCGSKAFEEWSKTLREGCCGKPDVETLQQAALKMENVGGWVAAWREGRHSHSCVEAKKLLFEPVLNCVILLNGIVLHAWHH